MAADRRHQSPRPSCRAWLRVGRILLGLVLPALPGSALGQTVVGRVVEEGGRPPVAGAFVVLVDSGGSRQAAGLTGGDGRFAVRTGRPGAYRLLVQRIGYRTTTVGPFVVSADAPVTLTVEVPGDAVPLEGVEVKGAGRCALRPVEGEPTYRLWEEARKALEVVDWTASDRRYVFDVALFKRLIDLETRLVRQEDVQLVSLSNDQPFIADPADSVEERSFVWREQGGRVTVFSAPDAAMLLSDGFLDTHCFRRVSGGTGLAGLAFWPIENRRGEVEGVLWLDRETAELRLLEFTYVRVRLPARVDPRTYGGTLRFRRLPDGAWIVSHWKVRSPTFARRRYSARHSGFSESEGDLLALRTLRGDPVPHHRDGARLVGQVLLPGNRGPAARAQVRLLNAPYVVVADEEGRFGIDGLPEARYRIEAAHEGFRGGRVEDVVELRRGATTTVRLGGR